MRRELSDRSTPFARELRKQSTCSEKLLWNQLRDRRFADFKFRRQYPIGNFIVDFYCAKASLVIELDSVSHDGKKDYDQRRDAWLVDKGLKVLRFSDDDAIEKLDWVLEVINKECVGRGGKQQTPHPGPLP